MRLPNGYGSITKLSGNRRKPWRVRKTDGWDIDEETGKATQRYVNIGCYETRAAALKALAEYNVNPYDMESETVTLKDVYEKWSERKYTEITPSGIRAYKAAWNVCKPIQNTAVAELKIGQLQKVAEESGKNQPILQFYKMLLKALFEYAVVHGVITRDKDIVEYIDISHAGNPNARSHKPFSKSELEQLWKTAETNECATIALMLIYTGVRIAELLSLKKSEVYLEQRYFHVVASKTASGIRSVPIAKKIIPYFQYWMNKNQCENLISSPKGAAFGYFNFYRLYWSELMTKLQMSHTPHDTRHTCVSMLTAAKVDERFIQKIVGHKGQNVTQQIYTHLEIEELIVEIDKI